MGGSNPNARSNSSKCDENPDKRRIGISSIISSDIGTPFIEQTLQKVISQLKVKWMLECVYHLQSQGIVERVNET